MRGTVWFFLSAWLLVIAPALAAGDEEGFSRPGMYVGAGVTYATDIFEGQLEDAVGFPVDVDPSLGAHGVLGYRVLPFLAGEIQYEWVDEFSIAVSGVDSAALEAQALTGNLKLYLPLWRFQPYFLAGAGFARWKIEDKLGFGFSDDDISFAGRAGLGMDVYLTRNIVVNGGANVLLSNQSVALPMGDVDYLFYVSAGGGLQYRFSGLLPFVDD